MSDVWYKQAHIKDNLILFGRAIQGRDPYEVHIETDPIKCRSAYCNFSARRIAVNPTLFDSTPAEQYLLTKALLIHEAGHKRYTIAQTLPNLVREIANVLEDERVDRLMTREFAAAVWFLNRLSRRFLDRAKPINEKSDSPEQVVSYFLQLRWANRCGKQVRGALSPKNQALWEQIQSIVHDSWDAADSNQVNENAIRIVDILGFGLYHFISNITTL